MSPAVRIAGLWAPWLLVMPPCHGLSVESQSQLPQLAPDIRVPESRPHPVIGAVGALPAPSRRIPRPAWPFAVCWWNVLSALTVPRGAVLAWLIAQSLSVAGLLGFASGQLLFIAAPHLVPAIKAGTTLRSALMSFGWFCLGLLLLVLLPASRRPPFPSRIPAASGMPALPRRDSPVARLPTTSCARSWRVSIC